MKKTVLITSIVLFVVGCVMTPVKTASQANKPTPIPVQVKSVMVKPPVVTDSNSSTTTNSGPVIFSHEREDITYIWDATTNCFYYTLNGKRINMPQGWRH